MDVAQGIPNIKRQHAVTTDRARVRSGLGVHPGFEGAVIADQDGGIADVFCRFHEAGNDLCPRCLLVIEYAAPEVETRIGVTIAPQ